MRKLLSYKLRIAAANVKGPIPKRDLGKTGLKITQLGLGGAGLLSRKNEEKEAVDLIWTAINLGINYFDTAPEYGPSQDYYGKALGKNRKNIILATKTSDRTREGAAKELKTALKTLKTDYLDIWQVHHIDDKKDVDRLLKKGGAIEAFEEAKRQGMVRHIGITGHRDPDALLYAIKNYEFDTVLMTLNAADVHYMPSQDKLLPEALKQGLGVIAMKIMCQGRILEPSGLNKVEKALQYVLTLPVSTAIVGCDDLRQLYENVDTAKSFKKLSKSEMKELEDATEKYYRLALFFRKGNEAYNPWHKPAC